jgi:hypothetical protein
MQEEGNEQSVRADVVVMGVPCLFPATLAKHLGIKKSTLAVWRSYRRGPNYRKIGNMIVYPIDEARRWFESTGWDSEEVEIPARSN